MESGRRKRLLSGCRKPDWAANPVRAVCSARTGRMMLPQKEDVERYSDPADWMTLPCAL